MSDASMHMEQEVVRGQETLSQPRKVDLEAFYQNELTRYRAENARPGQRSWGIIEKVAASRIDSPYQLSYEQMSHEQPPFTSFAPESIRKIDILSKALNVRLDARKIKELQSIIENPDYLDFAASLVQQKPEADRRDIPILDNILALDKAGLLKPLVNLYRSGIVLMAADRYGWYTYDKSLGTLFDGYVNSNETKKSSPKEVQEEAIKYLKERVIETEKVKDLLQDTQKQEFFGLVTNITGYPVAVEQVDSSYLPPDFFSGSREAVYLLKLTKNYGEKDHSLYLSMINAIASYRKMQGHYPADILEGVTDQDFPAFLITLHEKAGYTAFSGNGQIFDEITDLTETFNALEGKRDLIESVITVIKALNPNAEFNFPLLLRKVYIPLAKDPNMVQAISSLKEIGCKFSALDDIQQRKSLGSIANNHDALSKLASAELKSLSSRLARDFNWQANIHEVEKLIELFNDKEFQSQLFLPETADFIKKVMPVEPSLFTLRQMVSLDSSARDLLTGLAEQFNYRYNPNLHDNYVRLDKIPDAKEKLKAALSSIPPEELLSESNLKLFTNCMGNLELYKRVIQEKNTSLEFAKIFPHLLPLLAESSDPQNVFIQIKNVFERNSLPDFAKKFKIFEILYSEKGHLEDTGASPILRNESDLRRIDAIYRDLLKISIDSNDLSLRSYLETMQKGQQLFDKVETQGAESLSDREQRQVSHVLKGLNLLYQESLLGRRSSNKNEDRNSDSINLQIRKLKTDLKVRKGQTITDRVAEMFVKPLGYMSIGDVLGQMDKARKKTYERNVSNPDIQQGQLEIREGDLLKGIKSDIFGDVLQSGFFAREYLGVGAESDTTPLDSDLSMVLKEDLKGGLTTIIVNSLAPRYGDILVVLRNRGQLTRTDQQERARLNYDPNHYELFYSHGNIRHFGIRTGFPSTEIDGIILTHPLLAETEDARLKRESVFFNIANNGFYIPIADTTGKIIFTKDDYSRYGLNDRSVAELLNRSDFKPQEFLEQLKTSPYLKILYEMGSGVSEGYTVEQHASMVMSQFEKYFAKTLDGTPLLTRDEFRLMLALHDIGKPLAVHFGGSTSLQHEYTKKILPFVLQATNISPNRIDILASLIDQDLLGEYFKGQATAELSAQKIHELAESIRVASIDLLQILKIFYISDAGSYTLDAGGKESLDHLFQFNKAEERAEFSKDAEERYQRLVQEITKL